MSLPVPQLDDRRFQDIVDEAKTRLKYLCPAWTDHNVSDPGVTLIELFAWMTEMIIYRLNRVPEKQYVTLMQLLGVTLEPPRAATVPITFQLTQPRDAANAEPLIIPAGTEVATAPTIERPNSITFMVERDTSIVHPGLPTIYRRLAGPSSVVVPRSEGDFAMFAGGSEAGEPKPEEGDSFYLGFPEPIGGHTLQLSLDFKVGHQASGHKQVDGVPVQWQGWCGEDDWQPATVERDTTGGLTSGGTLDIRLPIGMVKATPPRLPGAEALYYLRCRYTPIGESTYKQTPIMTSIAVATRGVTALATHAASVSEELLGVSNGLPGQLFRLANAPVLPFEAVEAIEVETGKNTNDWQRWQPPPAGYFIATPKRIAPATQRNGHGSRANGTGQDPAFNHVIIDYATGEVIFGPNIREPDGTSQQYGNVPPRDARIRVSRYRFGGGVAGNVPADTLTVLKRTLPYVNTETRNHEPARGGRDVETLQQAMLRVPSQLHIGKRAVTSSDFEVLAMQADARVARVRCIEPTPAQQQALLADAVEKEVKQALTIELMPDEQQKQLADAVEQAIKQAPTVDQAATIARDLVAKEVKQALTIGPMLDDQQKQLADAIEQALKQAPTVDQAATIARDVVAKELKRALTVDQAATIARDTADKAATIARDVVAKAAPRLARTVLVIILPQADQPDRAPIEKDKLLASADLRGDVKRDLDRRRMLTTLVEVIPPRLVEVSVDVRIRIQPGADRPQIQQEGLRRLYRFLNPLSGGNLSGAIGQGWEFGRFLYPSEVLVLLQSIPGVAYIEWLDFQIQRWAVAQVGAAQELWEGKTETPTRTHVELRPDEIIISGMHKVDVS
jgi:hypothetical protein